MKETVQAYANWVASPTGALAHGAVAMLFALGHAPLGSVTFLAICLANVVRRYDERCKALEAELAALRAERSAGPLPVLNQVPERG